MPLSTHEASAAVFVRGLRGLAGVLDKAIAHAAAKGIDPEAFLQARLYPDMLAFKRQVQIATDFGRGAVARLAGAEVPAWDDVETSLDELKTRVVNAIAFIEGFAPAQLEGGEDRAIALLRRGETFTYPGRVYLLEQAMPNFFFHLTTAYDILRHNGVEIGKKDFLATA